MLEDAGAQTVAGWVTAFDPGPANESGQGVLGYRVDNLSNAAPVQRGAERGEQRDVDLHPGSERLGL
ncbi:MAG: hypothetical protein IPO08_11760 [Xanthomonadales bacterium]|nr:hypothetical protein [Xanthomonadales bacterium]